MRSLMFSFETYPAKKRQQPHTSGKKAIGDPNHVQRELHPDVVV